MTHCVAHSPMGFHSRPVLRRLQLKSHFGEISMGRNTGPQLPKLSHQIQGSVFPLENLPRPHKHGPIQPFSRTIKRMLRRAFSTPLRYRLGSLPISNKPELSSIFSSRAYSVASGKVADLTASKVTIENAKSPKPLTPQNELVFGHTFTGNIIGFGNSF
jgi:hypothetical protein